MVAKENEDKKRFVATHLDQADYDRLKELAAKEHRPVSNLARVCLLEYLEKMTAKSDG